MIYNKNYSSIFTAGKVYYQNSSKSNKRSQVKKSRNKGVRKGRKNKKAIAITVSTIIIVAVCNIFLFLYLGYNKGTMSNSMSAAEIAKKNKAEETKVLQTVKRGFQAYNSEKLNSYMNMFDDSSPIFDKTKQDAQNTFSKYNLKVTINQLELLSIDDDTAKVHIIQTTKKIKGPQYKNNMVFCTYELIKIKDQWKVTDMDIEKIDYI